LPESEQTDILKHQSETAEGEAGQFLERDLLDFFAHSENGRGEKHGLVRHLTAVADLASKFAAKFGAADFGYWAGLWHDLGKAADIGSEAIYEQIPS